MQNHANVCVIESAEKKRFADLRSSQLSCKLLHMCPVSSICILLHSHLTNYCGSATLCATRQTNMEVEAFEQATIWI